MHNHVRQLRVERIHLVNALLERGAGAEHGSVILHDVLHARAQLRRPHGSLLVAQTVKVGNGLFTSASLELLVRRIGLQTKALR